MWLLKHQQLHSGGLDAYRPGGWQLNRLTIHKPQLITTLQYYAIYVTGFWKNDPNRTLEVPR